MKTLKAYFSIFRIRLAEGLQYRAAALAGTATSIFWGIIEAVIFVVFYKYADMSDAGILAGLSLQQVISYSWLRQMLHLMQPLGIENEILGKIESGDVGIEMCRPLDLYLHWFARTAAFRLTPVLLRGAPILLFSLMMPEVYRLSAPASIQGFICFLLSLAGAVLLCTSYAMLACSIRLSITWGNGPMIMILLIGGVLSGTYLPLQLWPDSMQDFLLLQPFAGYLDIPVRYYIGTMPAGNILWTLGLQAAWSLVFIAAGRALMVKKLRKIVIQGG